MRTVLAVLALLIVGAGGLHAADGAIPGIERKVLLDSPLAQFPGKRVFVVTGDFDPGAETPVHRHPGTELLYVLEGEGRMVISGREPRELTRGGVVLVEPDPGEDSFTHQAINLSESDRMKTLVFIIHDEGTPPGLPPEAPVADASAIGVSPAAAEDWTAEQIEVIEAISAYEDAWNAGDADALAALFAEDYDRINALGRRWDGRAAVRDHYREAFATPVPPGVERRLAYEISSVRMIADDVAIVDSEFRVSGIGPTPEGTFEGLNTVVLVKHGGRWLRSAHRNFIPVRPGDARLATSRPAALGDRRTLAAERVEEGNEATVRAMIEAINARDLGALDDLVAADLVRHSQSTAGIQVRSLEDFKAFLKADFAAVPDSKQTCKIVIAEDDHVAVWCRYEGTQQGRLGPYPATGKPLSLDFAGFLRLAEGKIAEMWVVWDNLTALTQLGHLPPPGALFEAEP